MMTRLRVILTLYRAWEIPPVIAALTQQGRMAEQRPLRDVARHPSLFSADDVIVVDMRTNPTLGLQAIFALRRQHGYGPGILALVERNCASTIAAIEAGADSYLSGEHNTEILCAAISGLGRLTRKKSPHAARSAASGACGLSFAF